MFGNRFVEQRRRHSGDERVNGASGWEKQKNDLGSVEERGKQGNESFGCLVVL